MIEEIGPYRIVRLLGRGGMGVVYLAEHRETGERAALKTLHGADPRWAASIRREVRALARLRHPGIVRIREEGVDAGVPWYAMDLVEGRSLRSVVGAGSGASEATSQVVPTAALPTARIETAGTAPRETTLRYGTEGAPRLRHDAPGLVELLTLARRLCAPLGYMHGEGIVHRDLKPENVLLTPSGAPVILDFGLVRRESRGSSRESLESAGDIAGTVAYMAPEQAQGEIVDARADLYALGCILYELLAGRPPFDEPEPFRVIWRHLNALPQPPSQLADGIPPEIDVLLSRMLAKDPRDRPPYAGDVAAALAAAGARDGAYPGAPPARPHIYRPRLVGREIARHALEDAVESGVRGRGGLLLLAGESGSGKTRLAMEAARHAGQQGMDVVACGSEPRIMGPLEGLQGLLDAIADRCRAPATTAAALGPPAILREAARLLAPLHAGIRSLASVAALPEPPALPPLEVKQRLQGAAVAALEAMAAGRPLLLVADDVQWADELTLGTLGQLARRPLARLPLVAVVIRRAEEEGGALELAGEGTLLALDRLDDDALAAMVRDMLGEAPDALSRSLVAEARGNPFVAAEYVRAAVEEGQLVREASGRWRATSTSLPMPAGVRELVGSRIARVPPELRPLLEAAAVLGDDLSLDLLAEVAGTPEAQASDAVGELCRRQILEAGAEARFVHQTIQQAAYDAVEQRRRRVLHGRAAAAHERLRRDAREARPELVARHWELAGAADEACRCYLAAARRARDAAAFAEAERCYLRYLALAPPEGGEGPRARAELAEHVLLLAGRGEDAEHEAQRALAESAERDDPLARAASLLAMGAVAKSAGRVPEARTLLEEARAVARGAGLASQELAALNKLAIVARDAGAYDEAAARFEEARRLADLVGDRRSQAIALGNTAGILQELGRDDAQAMHEAALALFRELGMARHEAMTLTNLAHIHTTGGRHEQARALYEQALELARRLGDRRFEGQLLASLGVVATLEERSADGARLLEEALGIVQAMGPRRSVAFVLMSLGGVRQLEGDLEGAERDWTEGLAVAREVRDARLELVLLGDLARLGIFLGRIPRADAELDGLLERAVALGHPPTAARIACLGGFAALASGRSAAPLLARIASLATPSAERAGADRNLELLRHAEAAFAAGAPLIAGMVPEDVPPGLRGALAARGLWRADSGGDPGAR